MMSIQALHLTGPAVRFFEASRSLQPARQVNAGVRPETAKDTSVEERLRPSPEQYRKFNEYLCAAHSWYKHIPLFGGRHFVVFVAPDAGIGRLVAVLHGGSPETATSYSLVTPPDGLEFTDEHPRLHYGWKTTKEYRDRFGYLDYMRRYSPDGPYARDAGPAVSLPEQVEDRCAFVLYPYVHSTFAEAVTWSVHKDAIERLRAGEAHPAREIVLELERLAKELDAGWATLSDDEQLWVLSRQTGGTRPLGGEPSVGLREYLDLDDRVRAISARLQAQEFEKIRRALAELDRWLMH
jgi:hypothetical protein